MVNLAFVPASFYPHSQKAFEHDKQIREKEEKLILSAWYNLVSGLWHWFEENAFVTANVILFQGLKYHQQVSKERLASQVSFLSQQRQAALRKTLIANSSSLGSR